MEKLRGYIGLVHCGIFNLFNQTKREMERGHIEMDCSLSVLLLGIGSSCAAPEEGMNINLQGGVKLSEEH